MMKVSKSFSMPPEAYEGLQVVHETVKGNGLLKTMVYGSF
jgi:hypothetical protein